MGASLLDAVLAETLDPAYAQAAAARAARPRRTGPPPAPRGGGGRGPLRGADHGRRRAAGRGHLRPGGRRRQGREQVREALIDDIDRESGVSDDLADPARAAAARRSTSTRDELLAATRRRPAGARPSWPRAEQAAAAVPGHRARACWSPWPTPTRRPTTTRSAARPRRTRRGRVRDGDLQLVVNALWAAGAEAISINGQRLGPTTRHPVRRRGRAGRLPAGRPTRTRSARSAIPDTLRGKFLASPEVQRARGCLRVLRPAFRLRPEGRADPARRQHARAAHRRAGRGAAAAAAPAARRPDPTPGG